MSDQVEMTHNYVDKVLGVFDERRGGHGPYRRGGPVADAVYDILEDFIEEYKTAVGIEKDPESELNA